MDLSSSYALCEQDAEWIVEDFEEGGSLVLFADFGTVTFSDCSASGLDGSYGLSDANILEIEQTGGPQPATLVTISGSDITVKYE